MGAGELGRQRLRDRQLVFGVAVGMQQCDGDRLRRGLGHLARQRMSVVATQLAQRPVGGHALSRSEPEPRRREWRRPRRTEAIQLGPILAAEGHDVGEPVGGHERGSRAATFEQGVGRDGHPVREAANLIGAPARALQRGRDRCHHAF